MSGSIFVALPFALPLLSAMQGNSNSSDQQALATVDAFIEAFNQQDHKAWAATLNYPHVRVASGKVKVWQTAEEYLGAFDFKTLQNKSDWHHSEFDYKKIIQSSPDKVHVAVRFSRYREDGSKIASYEAIYVVTNRDGHWGVQARSSFAP